MSTISLRSSAVSRTSVRSSASRTVPRVSAVPRTWQKQQTQLPGRSSLRLFSSDTGAENDDKLVGEHGEILQGHQEKKTMGGAGMGSEEKRADMPAQGGAPEGDMAAAGQETQLTGQPTGGAPEGEGHDFEAAGLRLKEEQQAGSQPESGDKLPDAADKDASQVASQEASQQEDRTPMQD